MAAANYEPEYRPLVDPVAFVKRIGELREAMGIAYTENERACIVCQRSERRGVWLRTFTLPCGMAVLHCERADCLEGIRFAAGLKPTAPDWTGREGVALQEKWRTLIAKSLPNRRYIAAAIAQHRHPGADRVVRDMFTVTYGAVCWAERRFGVVDGPAA